MTTQTPRSIKLIRTLDRMTKFEKSWRTCFRKQLKRCMP